MKVNTAVHGSEYVPSNFNSVLFFDVPVVGILYTADTVVLALLPLVMSVVSILRIS